MLFIFADPNAIELISQFLVIPTENYTRKDVLTPDSEPTVPKPDSFNMGRKQLSVKVLILKVAAFSKWNLGGLQLEIHVKHINRVIILQTYLNDHYRSRNNSSYLLNSA